ncbi:MAG: ABC transporter substrate-binding protein [Desulfobacteraceae bacterium]|nr:ABC transporter substrate-binding protein [Desulfobacteraceae bacterium]
MKKKCFFSGLIVMLILFLFIGCQQSENDPPSKKTVEIPKASLQLQWFTQSQFAGYYVALEKGWYSEEGIDLTIYPGGPDIVPVDLVTGGSRDFGTTLLADLTVSIQKGKPAISIAQIQQNNGLRLLAKKSSGIKTPKDLIGKKVGVWLGGWEIQFIAMLAQKKITEDSVDVISQGFSMTPFLEGRLDVASAMIYNEYYMVLAEGIQKEDLNIIDYADYELGFSGDVLFTSQKIKKENPQLCLKMLRASLRGWQYALENPEEAAKIVIKHDKAGVATFDHQKKMMLEIAKLVKGSENTKMGYSNPEVLARMIDLLVQYKVLDSPIELEKVYTTEFINQIKN